MHEYCALVYFGCQSDVEMQKNLRGGSAADFGMTSEPFDGRPKATKRRDSDGEDQESVNRRLQDLSRLVTLGERSQQQISQSITEVSKLWMLSVSSVGDRGSAPQ